MLARFCKQGRAPKALLSAVSAALCGMISQSHAAITITQNSNSNWAISNGNLNVTFNPASNKLTSVAVGGSGNLLDPKNSQLYPEFAGTPFGSGAQTYGFQQTANYIDFWTTNASTGTTTNPITYSFHYVMYNNDPNISVYEVLNHSATDPATSVGQGQFLARVNPSQFNNTYQVNVSPNNIGVQTSVVPAYTDATARDVQDATVDISGEGLSGDWGSHFYTKYDYSSYTQFLKANTEFGANYAVSTIFTGLDSMTGGPTKQNLQYTNNIAMIEFLSGHYGDSNYSYTPQQGVASSRLFGPYDFRFTTLGGESGAQLNQDAVNSMVTLQANYNANTTLIANGYVPTSQRGSVAVTATSTAGWSSTVNNNTVVLSDPNKMFQESDSSPQYWAQLSSSGAATISNVIPGTYRATVYQLGQWGETRFDGIQTTGSGAVTSASLKFIPENFGTAAPIWTIGTPDRSSHEFLNGNATATNPGVVAGGDLRQFYGSYDYWAEEQALGNPGHVVYYATAVGGTPATNNNLAWISNQWGKFNPGLYDSANNTTDNYSNIAPAYVRDAAHGGTGPGPASYGGSAWDVNFTVTQAQINQGQFVTLTVGLAANEGSLTISLNGHGETWHFGGTNTDAMVRSGVAGVYQMLVYQWPVSDLNAAGVQDQFTFSVSQNYGDMYDALRMELNNTSAAPNTTGWHDYAYISTSNAQTNADNVLPTNPSTWNLSAGGSWSATGNWLFGVPNAAGATALLSSGPGLTASGNLTLDGTRTLGTLVFNDSQSYTIAQGTGGGSLILSNGSSQALISDEAGTHGISAPITLSSDTKVSVTTSTDTLNISGIISGAQRLLVTGAGTVSLSGNNNYSGDTAINSGTLNLTSTGHLASQNILVAVGATFKDAGVLANSTVLTDNGTSSLTSAAQSITTLNGLGALNLNPTLLTITAGGSFSGIAAGTGGLTVSGGALKLSGVNNYSSATSITAGSLEIASPGSIASANVSVAGGASMTVDSGAALSASTNLTDSGTTNLTNAAQTLATLGGAGTLNLISTALTVNSGGTFSGSIKSAGSVTLAGGTLTLSGSNTYTGSTSIDAGTLNVNGSITSAAVTVAAAAFLNVNGTIAANTALNCNGITTFAANSSTGILIRTLAGLTLSSGGLASIGIPSAPTNRTVLVTSALNFTAGGGRVDLTGNDLVIRKAVASDVYTQLQTGFNASGGYWDGANGIESSWAATNTHFLTTLGYSAGGALFDGVSTNSNDMLVKYTYFGDADLNGLVNGADYQQIDLGFGADATDWSNGDFNYDGVVNGSDFALIDNTFNQITATNAGPLAIVAASPTGLIASGALSNSVPEPAMLGLMAMAAIGSTFRRRRAPNK